MYLGANEQVSCPGLEADRWRAVRGDRSRPNTEGYRGSPPISETNFGGGVAAGVERGDVGRKPCVSFLTVRTIKKRPPPKMGTQMGEPV